MYLSPVIDCFDGQVVSGSIGTRPDAALVNTMIDAAIETTDRSGVPHLVHSDSGAHYGWFNGKRIKTSLGALSLVG